MIAPRTWARLEQIHKRFPGFAYEFCQWYMPDLSYRHIDIRAAFQRLWKHAQTPFRNYSLSGMVAHKRSDTIFILGCNRSILDITESQWEVLRRSETFGFNYWIFHPFVPTFYTLEDGKNRVLTRHHIGILQQRADDYRETIRFVSSRSRRRGIHPRIMPEYFPSNPRVHFYLYPKVINCPIDMQFTRAHFKESIFYRGTLNLILHICRIMKYQKIILVGCEMDSAIPYFENLPEAKWVQNFEKYSPEERERRQYGGAYDTKGKHSMIEVIRAINKFVFQPEGIELFVANRKSLLYPDVPFYDIECGPDQSR